MSATQYSRFSYWWLANWKGRNIARLKDSLHILLRWKPFNSWPSVEILPLSVLLNFIVVNSKNLLTDRNWMWWCPFTSSKMDGVLQPSLCWALCFPRSCPLSQWPATGTKSKLHVWKGLACWLCPNFSYQSLLVHLLQ